MKKRNHRTKALHLDAETLRALQTAELRAPSGGGTSATLQSCAKVPSGCCDLGPGD